VEDQCRLRLLSTANDVRGQWQAVCRHRVGAEPAFARTTRQYAGAAGPTSCAGAVCLRAVTELAGRCISTVRPRESGDPGRRVEESVQVALGSRLRGNERSGADRFDRKTT